MRREKRRAGFARGLALASLAALALLAGACAAAAPEPTPAPNEGVADPVLTPVASPRPTSTPSALEGADLDTLLRTAVCWYDDPTLAAECLPPSAEVVDAIGAMARSGDVRVIAPLVDMLWLEVGWERWVRDALTQVTGERLASAVEWSAWLALNERPLPDGYVGWKGHLLALIDPQYVDLLHSLEPPDPEQGATHAAPLRAEEVLWSFVGPDDMPPLEAPDAVHRLEQRYLEGGDRVTGVLIDGVARAYPDRVLAWHQLVTDEVSDTPLLVVRCLPCGGVAVFDARSSDGASHEFGTSGLTYHGRTLFYDRETMSLWDPVSGAAIAGPLAEEGVRLSPRPMLYTRWGDWSARYPNTSTLTLETGYVRDYAADVDELARAAADVTVAPLPVSADALPADTPVLGVTIGDATRAYRVDMVEARGIVHDTLAGNAIALLSLGPGLGATVFEAEGVTFDSIDGSRRAALEVTDSDGVLWFMDDETLVNARNARERDALPVRIASWGAWLDAYPGTSLWAP